MLAAPPYEAMRTSLLKLLVSLVALAVVAAGWFFLAPRDLRGSTAYVVTSGASMQPRFHSGDLAVVRATNHYTVGDIVAYHSRSLHTIVLHRIVALDGKRYVLKGDANSFRDPEHPARSQLMGKLWLHLPKAGTAFAALGTPDTEIIFGGLAILLLFTGGATTTRRRRRRRRIEAGKAGTPRRSRNRSTIPVIGVAIGITSAGLVSFLALGAVAFTRSLQKQTVTATHYSERGQLSYTAEAPAGATYPTSQAISGDPLFVRLIDATNLRFDYHFASQSPHALTGTATLDAELASSTGWTRNLTLQPGAAFNGDDAALIGTVHLHAIERLLRRLETETASNNATYTLTILPRVQIHGRLADARIQKQFAPRIPFTIDQTQLRLLTTENLSVDKRSPAGNPNPLTPLSLGSVHTTKETRRSISVANTRLHIEQARRVATIGAAATLTALLMLVLLTLRLRFADEATRIQARHGDLLIPVSRTDRHSYDELVELQDFKTLKQIAKRYDRLILHEQSALGHSYRVADEGILYIYLIGNGHGLLPQPTNGHTKSQSTPQPSPQPQRRR